MKNIHIGQLIKEKFEERQQVDKHLTKASFARQINVHRSTLYLLFSQKSIDIELLINISKVLSYSFIETVYLQRPVAQANKVFVGVEFEVDELGCLPLPANCLQLFPQRMIS